MNAASPIAILRDIERRSLECSAARSSLDAIKVEWRGLSFRVGGVELLTPMSDIYEVLEPLQCTPIPRSKIWFDGIANVRGTLVPVMDFYSFLFGERKPVQSENRIIVFRLPNSVVGLIVTAIGGLRHHFMDEQVDGAPDDMDGVFSPYVRKKFQLKEGERGVFDINKLAVSEDFLKISEQ